MKAYEHKKEFLIKYCDVDFKDELKISAALSYMEEVACSSADELGFGYAFVKPRGYAFMVTNIHAEFIKPVPLGKLALVKTWPTPPTHVIFGREYQFTDAAGEIYCNATSRWCLIDLSSGRILQSKAVEGQDYSTYNTTRLVDGVRWKLPTFAKEEGKLKFSFTVANSEYDHNMHVNNTRYADYCMNCFSVEELAVREVKSFTASYVKQCKEGQTLAFYRKEIEDGSYLIEGFNDVDEIVMQARVVFKAV